MTVLTTRDYGGAYMTVSEVAAELACSEPTVRRRIRDGSLPAVLAVLERTPTFISSCRERWPQAGGCAPSDPEEWGRLAGEVAAHARGTIHHWQIRNEPDLDTRFDGPPQEYARMLGLAHRHIKARVPEATIVLGGLLRSPNEGWLELFFAAAGPDAARSFDVASVHVRGRLAVVVGQLRAVRAAFARYGFVGPFWVTEHAYPADPVYQPEPRLRQR